jgi:DNA transformation protein and related proteins
MPRAVKKKPASRGRLKSLRVSDSFRAYVLEQLSGVKGLLPRAMFGGVGLYAGEHFFGILAADTLYFRVDDSNRDAYEAAGMTAFKPYADRPMSMSYWRVPVGVLEDADELPPGRGLRSRWRRKAAGKGSDLDSCVCRYAPRKNQDLTPSLRLVLYSVLRQGDI